MVFDERNCLIVLRCRNKIVFISWSPDDGLVFVCSPLLFMHGLLLTGRHSQR